MLVFAGAVCFVLLISLGVFAANGWLPRTDAFSGEKFGWFGKRLPKNHTASIWNPLPPPSPTPQLSKEYIYAGGSRLLAVEDANAPAPVAESYSVDGFVMSDTLFASWSSTRYRPAQADTLEIVEQSSQSSVIHSEQVRGGTSGDAVVYLPLYLWPGNYTLRYMKNGTTEVDSFNFTY